MKKSLLFAAISFTVASASAQTLDTKKLTDNVTQKNYVAALNEVNLIKKKISDLAAAELLKAFPQKFGEYQQQPSNRLGGDMMGGIGLNIIYAKPAKEVAAETAQPAQPVITPDNKQPGQLLTPAAPAMPGMMGGQEDELYVTVTNNLNLAHEVSGAHSGEEYTPMGGIPAEPVRIKGYRALLKNDPYSGPTAQIIIGATFVEVKDRKGTDTKRVAQFLENVDIEKLKSIFGE